TLLYRLARVISSFARINAADALNEVRSVDETAGTRLLDEWAASTDASLRWLAVCSLIVERGQRKWKRSQMKTIEALRRFMAEDSTIFADAIRQAILDDYYSKEALTTLSQLAQQSKYGAHSIL